MNFPAEFTDVFSRLNVTRQRGRDYDCLCPAHDDRLASLVVTISEDNACLLFFCRAGCDWESVLSAAGIERRELFRRNEKDWKPVVKRIAAEYAYHDESGNELFRSRKYEWKTEDGETHKSFSQGRMLNGEWIGNIQGVRRVLYRLPELIKKTGGTIIVEGEKDAGRLIDLGFNATTNPGGAKNWKVEYAEYLTGKQVAIIPDNDSAGVAHAIQVAGSLIWHGAKSIRIVRLPGLKEHGDVSDYFNAGGTRESLLEIIKQSREWL